MAPFRRIDMPHDLIVTGSRARRCSSRGRPIFVFAMFVLGAGEKPRAAPPIDSAVPLRPATLGSSTPQTATTWDGRLGPVLLVGGASPDLATVVVGDSSRAGADTITAKEAIAIRSTPAVL